MKKRFNEWKLRVALLTAEHMSDAALAFFVSEAVLRYTVRREAEGADTSCQLDIMWELMDFLLPVPPKKERAVE